MNLLGKTKSTTKPYTAPIFPVQLASNDDVTSHVTAASNQRDAAVTYEVIAGGQLYRDRETGDVLTWEHQWR